MSDITIIAAFIAGIFSFLSPCVLPLIPAFLAYLAGTNLANPSRLKMFLNSAFYVLGFSFVFSIIGLLLNSVLERISYDVQLWLSRIGGIIIILFGLYVLGLIKFDFLETEHSFKPGKFSSSYLTSFVFGMAFAAGWTPCVGAVLGSVFALALTQPGLSFTLLFAYSLGLGIPFLITGLFSTQAIKFIRKAGIFLKYFNLITGIILIIIGILVFTQTLGLLANLEVLNYFLLK